EGLERDRLSGGEPEVVFARQRCARLREPRRVEEVGDRSIDEPANAGQEDRQIRVVHVGSQRQYRRSSAEQIGPLTYRVGRTGSLSQYVVPIVSQRLCEQVGGR